VVNWPYTRMRAAVDVVHEARITLDVLRQMGVFYYPADLPERLAVLQGALDDTATDALRAMSDEEWQRTKAVMDAER
jgi:hypothetical protein